MFYFLQKKTMLKELIPTNYIDIHSHILPGIDDGAATIEDSLFLVNELQKLGFSRCITTPHIMTNVWDNTKEIIGNAHQNLLSNISNKVQLPIQFAAEYMIDSHFANRFQNESLLTLKDNLVLVEISYLNPPIQLFEILFELHVAGYQPLLAHPERYNYYHNQFAMYEKLKNAGCLFQLNLLSTIGYYGLAVAKTAEKLLNEGMIDFVGSDVHHGNHIKSFSSKILVKNLQPLKEAIANNQFFATS